jgi:LPXTG-motif cell wall-anchored protein
MAAGTALDTPLSAFVETYPPQWDGFIELRLYLSTANQPAEVSQYPALDIQVTGSTWHTVGGGPVDCTAGQATSLETTLLPTTTTTTTATPGATASTTLAPSARVANPTPTTAPASGDANGGGGGGGGSGTTVSQAHGPGSGGTQGTSSTTTAGKGSQSLALRTPAGTSADAGPVLASVIAGLLLVGGAAALLVRRRRRRPGPDATPDDDKLREDAKSDKNHVPTMKGN